jgi:hypothetical protein
VGTKFEGVLLCGIDPVRDMIRTTSRHALLFEAGYSIEWLPGVYALVDKGACLCCAPEDRSQGRAKLFEFLQSAFEH